MKKSIVLLVFFLVTTNLASAQRKAKNKKSGSVVIAAASKSTHYAVIVSFISIGAGIDHEAVQKLEAFVNEHPKKPVYDKVQQGREGEMEYRFQLKEFSTAEQKTFIDELKKAAGSSDLVKFSENQDRVKK